MTLPALDAAARQAGARIIAALAARFRDLDLAEEALAEACARAAETWPRDGVPANPAGWLYRAAERRLLDALRKRAVRDRLLPQAELSSGEDRVEEPELIPDERLRLIFVCCHPAVAPDARAALTLRLVCGLTTAEIARAFLLGEAALAQRLVRAKRKIAEAGVPFEIPGPALWTERLEAVLTTLEIAYSKAHEDAAGSGPHAGFAAEMLELTRVLAELLPDEPDVHALAAIVRYAEARRPARTNASGAMVPLSEQAPGRWRNDLIAAGHECLRQADPNTARGLQALIHAAWCRRRDLDEPPPWPEVLRLYDALLDLRSDDIIRLNRAVALAELAGVSAALEEVEALNAGAMANFLPYHALRADLLRRSGRTEAAASAYDRALALLPPRAERIWLQNRRDGLMSDAANQ